MEKNDLIGKWQCSLTGNISELHPDGNVTNTGESSGEKQSWEYVDDKHWKLKIEISPDPDTSGLEEGAIEVLEYEVESFDGKEMKMSLFDYEFPFIWEKKD